MPCVAGPSQSSWGHPGRAPARHQWGPAGYPDSYSSLLSRQRCQWGSGILTLLTSSSRGAAGLCTSRSQVASVQGSGPTGVVSRSESSSSPHIRAPSTTPLQREGATLLPIRVIGVGTRANAVLGKLNDAAAGMRLEAEYWATDWDAKQLEAATVNGAQGALLQLPQPDGLPVNGQTLDVSKLFRADDLAQITGPVRFADGSQGCAVVCVLACGGDSFPGGPSTVPQLVAQLRTAGHFVMAVVTQPFSFEGPRKAKASEKLLKELHSTAHTVITVDQNVLVSATKGLAVTAQQAKQIADGALEHAVRGLVGALWCNELLVLCNGAAAWHGKARGHYLRQRMSSPLQQLLTRQGTFTLGRGLAGMPRATALAINNSGTTLQCLAADAVAAAAESPFLADGLMDAVALLCCIQLPSTQDWGGNGVVDVTSTTRLAVQAAAGSLLELMKDRAAAQSMLICAQPKPYSPGQQNDSVTVEATLMIVRAVQQAPPAPGIPLSQPVNSFTARRRSVSSPTPTKLPATAWRAMSALAGGTAQSLKNGTRAPWQSPNQNAAPGSHFNSRPLATPSDARTPVREGPSSGANGAPGPLKEPLTGPNRNINGRQRSGGQSAVLHASANGDASCASAEPISADETGQDCGPVGQAFASGASSSAAAATSSTTDAPPPDGSPVGVSSRMQSLDVPNNVRDKYPLVMDLPKEAIIWRMQQRSVVEVVDEVTDEGGMLSIFLPVRPKPKPEPPSEASARTWLLMGEEWSEDSDDEDLLESMGSWEYIDEDLRPFVDEP